ncbi:MULTISPECIES: hypothetical protein [Sphingobacterium]|uniref:hypothetical protein n=1 Tax=Sphingobacterium TaxID=28453 RepID=UPI00258073B9|nr:MULTISPECIES: hypothetical protein [Sphingobacterium]
MKRLILMVFFISFACSDCWSQSQIDSTLNDLDKIRSQSKENLEKIRKKLQEVEDDERESVGKLVFGSSVPIYEERNGKPEPVGMATIEKVEVSIYEGFIRHLKVKIAGKNGSFSNTLIMGITEKRLKRNRAKYDVIYLEEPNTFIIIQDLIALEHPKSYLPEDVDLFTYIPASSDENLKKNELVLYKKNGINTLFDVRLYSDLLSLLGDEKNALAQTDIRFRQTIHRTNIRNLPLFFIQYFKVNFNYSKFDSKDEYVMLSSFSNTDVLRKRFINAELALNAFNGYIGPKATDKYYFDIGVSAGKTRLKRSETDSVNIDNTDIFFEGGVSFKFSSNSGVNANIRAIRLFSPSTIGYNDQINKSFINFMRYSVDLFWNPAKEKANRLFLRMNYVDPTNGSYKKEGFLQAQFGYSLLFSELINKN